LNILLAEDDRNLATVIKQELEDDDHSIDLVHDGVEAVLRVIDRQYHCILIDIVMPNLDGINALRIIKRLSPDVPVIVLSGNAGADQTEASCRMGAIKCLAKPFSMSELKGDIEKYTEQ
jgi:DNA-binding response OmpR family regulator